MLTTTLSDFRKDIKSYFDRVIENVDILIINRGKDTGVVIMSLEECNSLKSTHHELLSLKNQHRLDESIQQLNSEHACKRTNPFVRSRSKSAAY
jgi:antitoxin YefM